MEVKIFGDKIVHPTKKQLKIANEIMSKTYREIFQLKYYPKHPNGDIFARNEADRLANGYAKGARDEYLASVTKE